MTIEVNKVEDVLPEIQKDGEQTVYYLVGLDGWLPTFAMYRNDMNGEPRWFKDYTSILEPKVLYWARIEF